MVYNTRSAKSKNPVGAKKPRVLKNVVPDKKVQKKKPEIPRVARKKDGGAKKVTIVVPDVSGDGHGGASTGGSSDISDEDKGDKRV